jgi:PAS domain S-box-containing protein
VPPSEPPYFNSIPPQDDPLVSTSRSPEAPSDRPLRTLLPYGISIASVTAAVLLVQGVNMVSGWDVSPLLLVAVALSALYGGTGPGILAAVFAAVVSSDPGAGLAGLALTAVCRLYHRLPAPAEKGAKGSEPTPGETHPVPGGSIAFSPEIRHTPPPFIEVTTEATWRFHHEKPLDITLPEDEQVEHLYLYSSLAECNDAFARMYGFRTAADVIGTRLVVFCPPSNAENVAYLRSFIRSGYRLEDAESQEIDRYGNAKYFVNNLVGIFERGQLVGAWGTQRDITEKKRSTESQEYRSRIHSAKSSSQ